MKHVQKKLAQLIEPFSGKWVALTPDEKTVLGVSKNMKKAINQAHEKGEPQPFLIKSPDAYTAAVFY
ncbi:MAG: hypothetical protein HY591_02185 [Candidatus Omnitrophica bacterium]|nr:hypothetical protein [Candidatus Omnitrophota bacterium]